MARYVVDGLFVATGMAPVIGDDLVERTGQGSATFDLPDGFHVFVRGSEPGRPGTIVTANSVVFRAHSELFVPLVIETDWDDAPDAKQPTKPTMHRLPDAAQPGGGQAPADVPVARAPAAASSRSLLRRVGEASRR